MSNAISMPPLRFKGERDYIQGPDLFNSVQAAMNDLIGPDAWIERASMRDMASGAVDLIEGDSDDSLGFFEVRSDAEPRRFSLIPAASDLELNREPYDESLVVERGHFDSERAFFKGKPPYSVMEVITSLAKALHNRELPISGGKWIWVGVQLQQPMPFESESIEVLIRRRLGSRMTLSDIIIDDQIIGTLTFAVKT